MKAKSQTLALIRKLLKGWVKQLSSIALFCHVYIALDGMAQIPIASVSFYSKGVAILQLPIDCDLCLCLQDDNRLLTSIRWSSRVYHLSKDAGFGPFSGSRLELRSCHGRIKVLGIQVACFKVV